MKDKVLEKGKAIKEGVGNAMNEMADGVHKHQRMHTMA